MTEIIRACRFLLPPDKDGLGELEQVADLIMDELNVKEIVMVEDDTELSEVSYKPNFRSLGPRFGKRMKEVASRIQQLTPADLKILNAGEKIAVAEGEIGLSDIEVQRQEKEDVVVAVDNNLCVGLDTHLDENLVMEGRAREFVNRVQNMRKEAGFDVADRIYLWTQGSTAFEKAIQTHKNYIAAETLALDLQIGSLPPDPLLCQEWQVDDEACTTGLKKVESGSKYPNQSA